MIGEAGRTLEGPWELQTRLFSRLGPEPYQRTRCIPSSQVLLKPVDTDLTQLQGLFSGAYIRLQTDAAVAEGVHGDAHAQRCEWSQLLQNHIDRSWGERARPSWLICSFPTVI